MGTGRDDLALYLTMEGIRNRLQVLTTVNNPVDSSEEISKGADDPKIQELFDRLDWAVGRLEDVYNETCNKNEALKRWNEIFNTDFFSQFIDEDDDKKDKQLSAAVGAMVASSPKQWACE